MKFKEFQYFLMFSIFAFRVKNEWAGDEPRPAEADRSLESDPSKCAVPGGGPEQRTGGPEQRTGGPEQWTGGPEQWTGGPEQWTVH